MNTFALKATSGTNYWQSSHVYLSELGRISVTKNENLHWEQIHS